MVSSSNIRQISGGKRLTKKEKRELRLKTRRLDALICLLGILPVLIGLLTFCAYLNTKYPTPKHRTRTPLYTDAGYGWAVDMNGWHYTPKEGPSPVASWYTIEGRDYYFNDYGYMTTGWASAGGKLYNFDIAGEKQTDMWATDDNSVTYRLGKDGTPVIGWYTDDDGSRYHFDDFGAMQTPFAGGFGMMPMPPFGGFPGFGALPQTDTTGFNGFGALPQTCRFGAVRVSPEVLATPFELIAISPTCRVIRRAA